MATRETQYETLYNRVDHLIRSHKGTQPLLATATTHETIRELLARSEGLERSVREIALEVEGLVVSPAARAVIDADRELRPTGS